MDSVTTSPSPPNQPKSALDIWNEFSRFHREPSKDISMTDLKRYYLGAVDKSPVDIVPPQLRSTIFVPTASWSPSTSLLQRSSTSPAMATSRHFFLNKDFDVLNFVGMAKKAAKISFGFDLTPAQILAFLLMIKSDGQALKVNREIPSEISKKTSEIMAENNDNDNNNEDNTETNNNAGEGIDDGTSGGDCGGSVSGGSIGGSDGGSVGSGGSYSNIKNGHVFAEIGAGEGKSMVVAMTAVYRACYGMKKFAWFFLRSIFSLFILIGTRDERPQCNDNCVQPRTFFSSEFFFTTRIFRKLMHSNLIKVKVIMWI